MKLVRLSKYTALVVLLLSMSSPVYAATDPGLGAADTYSILSGTYTNTAIGTTINGDLGYATGPVVAPTVNGNTYAASGTYAQAGLDQGTALAALNSQPCTFSFAIGAVNLATDTTHGPVGVYTPGVYCINGAVSVGTGGITMNGSGSYIFRMTGALTTAANSVLSLSGGATACSIWWTPGAATTLGANSTFGGTDIDPSGITIGSTVAWTGRALAFGGTVSTVTDTINTVPACSAVPPVTPAPGSGGTTTPVTTGAGGPSLTDTGLELTMISILAGAILVTAVGIRFWDFPLSRDTRV